MLLSSAVSPNTKVHDIVDVSMPSTSYPRDVDGTAPMGGADSFVYTMHER